MKSKSLLTGLIAGTAIGLFFAPKKGKQIRNGLKKDIKKGNYGLSFLKDIFVDMGKEMGDCYTECVPEETAGKIKDKAESAKEMFNEKKEVLKSKVDELKDSFMDKEEELEEKAKEGIEKAKKTFKKTEDKLEKKFKKTVKDVKKVAKTKMKDLKK